MKPRKVGGRGIVSPGRSPFRLLHLRRGKTLKDWQSLLCLSSVFGLEYFFDALWSHRFEQPNVRLRCECCEKRSEMIESHYRVSHTNEGLLAGNAKRAVSLIEASKFGSGMYQDVDSFPDLSRMADLQN